jgi:hypothetical protein
MSDKADLVYALINARYLVTASSAILAMPPDNEVGSILLAQLNQNLTAAHEAIGAVTRQLRRARAVAATFGDIAAPSAHEAAIELAFAINRECIGRNAGVEVIGKAVQHWPKMDELRAEIELEHQRAVEQDAGENNGPSGTKGTKGEGINDQMFAIITKDQSAVMLSSNQWAERLDCAKSTVLGTQAWNKICRPITKAERAEYRKRLRDHREDGNSDRS